MHLGINDGDTRGAMPWDIYNRAAVICQIESKVGAENADAISAIEGGESAGPQYTALLAHPSVLRVASLLVHIFHLDASLLVHIFHLDEAVLFSSHSCPFLIPLPLASCPCPFPLLHLALSLPSPPRLHFNAHTIFIPPYPCLKHLLATPPSFPAPLTELC